MRRVHEAAERVGAAVEMRRSEQVHAVIAPAKPSREFSDGHNFQYRDAGFGQVRQFGSGARPGAFFGKSSDVQFIDNLGLERYAAPGGVSPFERAGVHHLGSKVWAVRLKAGGRIGKTVP